MSPNKIIKNTPRKIGSSNKPMKGIPRNYGPLNDAKANDDYDPYSGEMLGLGLDHARTKYRHGLVVCGS